MNAAEMKARLATADTDAIAEVIAEGFRQTAEQQGALYGIAPETMARALLMAFNSYSLTHMTPGDLEAGLRHVLARLRLHIEPGNETRQ